MHTPEYDWGTGPGAALCSNIVMTPPVFAYIHVVSVAVVMSSSFSLTFCPSILVSSLQLAVLCKGACD